MYSSNYATMLGLALHTWPSTPGIKRIAISYRRWSNDDVAEVVDVRQLAATEVVASAAVLRFVGNLSTGGLGRALRGCRRFRHRRGRHHAVRVLRTLPHHPRATGGGIRRKGIELTAVGREDHDVGPTHDPLIVRRLLGGVGIRITCTGIAPQHVSHTDCL